jgi:hypothetical protein
LAALVAQFGAVLSLFLAHAVLQVVPQEAGRFGIQYRLRSAFVGGAGILCALFSEGQYLSAQEGLHALLPRKWGVHFRAADPGIWTVAARAQGRRAPLKGGGWQGYLQYDQGGTIQGRLQQWVVLGDDAKLGSGLARNARGIGSLLLSVGIQDWAAHITIPLRQPHPRPFQSTWQWSARFPLIQDALGMADIQWHPGSLPLLSLTAVADKWAAGAGSAGAWLSFGHALFGQSAAVKWRLTVGVLRGDIPWTGIDLGSNPAFGSDPAQQWHLQWLWQ